MVRLITHNLLACHAKGCTTNNFPLKLQDVSIEVREAELNEDFLKGFLPRIEWQALVDAARTVRFFLSTQSFAMECSMKGSVQLGDTSLPPVMPELNDNPPEEFWKSLHHVLLEVCAIDIP